MFVEWKLQGAQTLGNPRGRVVRKVSAFFGDPNEGKNSINLAPRSSPAVCRPSADETHAVKGPGTSQNAGKNVCGLGARRSRWPKAVKLESPPNPSTKVYLQTRCAEQCELRLEAQYCFATIPEGAPTFPPSGKLQYSTHSRSWLVDMNVAGT